MGGRGCFEPADVVISTHVAYVVRDIAGFVRKMDLHARKMVRIVLYPFSPQSEGFEIWERVHGEKRLALPGLPQLLDVMEELKIPFESEPLSANHPRELLDAASKHWSRPPAGSTYNRATPRCARLN